MNLEAAALQLVKPLFNGKAWFNTTPDNYRPVEATCIIERVGGDDEWFVDNSLPEWSHGRLQFWIWAERDADVYTKRDELRAFLAAASDNKTFIIAPVGSVVSAYNEPLKIRGVRQDFRVWHKAV